MSAWHKGSDPHAGGGHAIATPGVGLRGGVDCPECRLGTLDGNTNAADDTYTGTMQCIDCGKVFDISTLIDLHLLPNAPRQDASGTRANLDADVGTEDHNA
jgi:hypothetical protein